MREYLRRFFAPKPKTEQPQQVNKEALLSKVAAEKRNGELKSILLEKGYTEQQLEELVYDKTNYVTSDPMVEEFFITHQRAWDIPFFEANNQQEVEELMSRAEGVGTGIVKELVNPNQLESRIREQFYGKVRAYAQHDRKKLLFVVLDPKDIHIEIERQFTPFKPLTQK